MPVCSTSVAQVAGTPHENRAVRPGIGHALSMRDILPAEVRCHEATVDVGLEALHELERVYIERAVPSRQSEFATVRACARLGLQDLGAAVGSPILPGPHGAPVWPPGIVGSMTHCTGYRAAAVGHAHPILSIGIDAEPNAPLPDGLIDSVAAPGERSDLAELTELDPHVAWDRVLFSAKESIYKAWFPLTGRWLGYEDAIVRIDPATTTYEGTIRDAGPVVAGPAHVVERMRRLADQQAGIALAHQSHRHRARAQMDTSGTDGESNVEPLVDDQSAVA